MHASLRNPARCLTREVEEGSSTLSHTRGGGGIQHAVSHARWRRDPARCLTREVEEGSSTLSHTRGGGGIQHVATRHARRTLRKHWWLSLERYIRRPLACPKCPHARWPTRKIPTPILTSSSRRSSRRCQTWTIAATAAHVSAHCLSRPFRLERGDFYANVIFGNAFSSPASGG